MNINKIFWEKEQEYAKAEFGSELKFRNWLKEMTGKKPNFPDMRSKGRLPAYKFIKYFEPFLTDDERYLLLQERYKDVSELSELTESYLSNYYTNLVLSPELRRKQRIKRQLQRQKMYIAIGRGTGKSLFTTELREVNINE